MSVHFPRLAVRHPDRGSKVLAESGHPERQYIDSGIGLAVVTQWARDSTGGMFSIPRTNPRPDTFLQMLHDLRCNASVNILSFRSVLHGLVLLQNELFLRETRDGFKGVQRRGPVKGAVCPRSSKTLDREHRWNNAGF